MILEWALFVRNTPDNQQMESNAKRRKAVSHSSLNTRLAHRKIFGLFSCVNWNTYQENQRIKALTVPAGCPKPSCLGKNKFKVIDAWKRKSNNALYQWDYGFSALIELPMDAYDGNGGSILLRFAQGNRQGSIQTWNFRYFGFYNNNNDVLFHTKVEISLVFSKCLTFFI